MDKITFLCLTNFIKDFNTSNSLELLSNIKKVSEWLTKSVSIIGRLNSFNDVQEELLNLAQFIAQGKNITVKLCYKLVNSLIKMQEEMLGHFKIMVFVTEAINLKFNDNVEVVIIKNTEETIDLAYNFQNELKYLVYMKNEKIDDELKNAVDIVINFEELIKVSDKCYPIDVFSYDRLYLNAKLNKLKKEKSKVLITGSKHATVGLLEEKFPYKSSNVSINCQDLYYSLISVREAIKASDELDTIIISFPYYFLFLDIVINSSESNISFLSRVFYPVYSTLGRYRGNILPLYIKEATYPIYEAIINLENVRDVYHDAIINDLGNMMYYNEINVRPDYEFYSKNEREKYNEAKVKLEEYNNMYDLDKAMENRTLLDKFLENMEELNKKVILFVPPATKFYRDSILKEMIGIYKKMVLDVTDKYECCKFIDLFDSEKFDETDFYDHEMLNEKGAKKLSDIISEYIKTVSTNSN